MRSLRGAVGVAVLAGALAGCTAHLPLTLDPAWEVERGKLHGRRVDAALVEQLAADGDEPSLALVARAAREPALRTQAARSLVRLRIARSPFEEVRADAAAVEETVLRLGVNPISLAVHPPRAARLALDVRGFSVAQRWSAAALRVQLGEALSARSEVPVRDALQVELAGLSRPVTLCSPPGALDPTPCVASADVRSGAGVARVEHGVLRLADSLDPAAVAAWAGEARLAIPLRIGAGPTVTIAGPLRFEPPDGLVLTGGAPGTDGPDLRVAALLRGERLEVEVESAEGTYRAVLERQDALALRIVSRGAPGAEGAAGWDGSAGASGLSASNASCPPFARAAAPGAPGQAGGSGGPGAAGGPGGRGGAIDVVVTAPAALREDTLRLLRAVVASEGGAGGAGGRGGSGGSGGAGGTGGSGTTCSDDDGRPVILPASPDGAAGPDGPDGPDGAPGPAGAPGTVRLRVAE